MLRSMNCVFTNIFTPRLAYLNVFFIIHPKTTLSGKMDDVLDSFRLVHVHGNIH